MDEFEIKIPVTLEDKTDGAAVVEKIDSAIEEAIEGAEKLGKALSNVDKNGRARGSDGRFLKMGAEADQAKQKVDKFGEGMQKTQAQIEKMNRTRIEMVISALDKASPALKAIWGYAKNLGSKAINMTLGLIDKATAPIKGIFKLLANPITMALSVAGIGLGAKDFFDIHSDFTTQMSGVRALTSATDTEFKMLVETAKELGAATSFSASEAAKGMQYLGMAGWKTNEIVEAMPGLLDLAAAGGTDLAKAADIVSDVMTAMDMAADQSGRAADIFAKTATASNTSIEMLGDTMKYAAPIAHSFGLSLEEASALAGQMANAGIKGSMAGTAIRSSLMSMAAPTKDAASLMKKLKLSFSNTDGSMKDMRTIVTNLSAAFGKLTEAQKLEYAETLFGTYAASGWLGVINQGAESYRAFEDAIINSTGAAEQMAKIRLDNIGGDIEELSGAVETAKLDLMERLDPHLRAGVQWFTGLIPGIKDGILSLTDNIIAQAGEMKDRISEVMSGSEWQSASIAGKAFMLWDSLIAQPFSDWWNGSGKGQVVGIVHEIGNTIGETMYGMAAGAMSIISGQDLDASGLKLNGIAQAGLQAGGEFVTSFLGGLNLGGLAGKIPGFIAGLFGNSMNLLAGGGASSLLSAVVLGKGIMNTSKGIGGFVKMVGDVKKALGGEATAAATAATKTGLLTKSFGTATTIGGGAMKLFALMPGWGWATLAALTAAGIGIKVYNDRLEEHRQELMHSSDAGKAALENWKEIGELSGNVGGLVDQHRRLEMAIDIVERGKKLSDIDAQIAELKAKKIELEASLDKSGITTSEATAIRDQIGEVTLKIATLSVIAGAPDVEAITNALDIIEKRELALTAQLADPNLSPDMQQEIQDKIDELEAFKIILQADGNLDVIKEQIAGVEQSITEATDGRIDAEGKVTAEIQRQLALLQEIARLDLETQVSKGREMIEEQVAKRDEYKKNYEEKEQEATQAKERLTEIDRIAMDYDTLRAQRDSMEQRTQTGSDNPISHEDYEKWQKGALQSDLFDLDQRYRALGFESNGMYDTTKLGMMDFGETKSILSGQSAEADRQAAASQADYNAQNANVVQHYMNETGLVAANSLQSFQGTEFGGKSAESLAPLFGQMNRDQQAAFMSMLDELQLLNDRTSYISDAEKLSVDNLRQIAEQSEAAAKAAEATEAVESAEDKRIMSTEQVSTAIETLEKSSSYTSKDPDTAYTKKLKQNEDAYDKVQKYKEAKENGKDTSEYEKYFDENKDLFGSEWKYDADNSAAWLEKNVVKERHGIEQDMVGQMGGGYVAAFQAEQDFVGLQKQNATLEQQQAALVKAKEAMDQYNAATKSGDAEAQAQAVEQVNEKLKGTGQTFGSLAELGGGDAAAGLDATFAANEAAIQENIAGMEQAKTQYDAAIAALQAAIATYQFNAKQNVNEALKVESLDTTDLENLLNLVNDAQGKLGELKLPSPIDITVNSEQVDQVVSKVGSIPNPNLTVSADYSQLSGADSLARNFPSDIYSTIHILVQGSIPSIPTGGSTGADHNATGGIYGKGAFLSWVAEAGREAIIPLDGQYKSRGIDLWMQAGHELGIMENAAGGIYSSDFPQGMNLYDEPIDTGSGYAPTSTSAPVRIVIEGMKNEFKIEITGNATPEMADELRNVASEIADDLAAQFAETIDDIFSNQPVTK